jgi:hypothetical protein
MGSTDQLTYAPASEEISYSPGFWWMLIAGLHIPLAYLMFLSQSIATAYPIFIFGLSVLLVLIDSHPWRVIYLAGYLAGIEILLRMTNSQVFWEFGKYSVSLLLILAWVKWVGRFQILPVLYFICLIPSAILTISLYPTALLIRKAILFNLSGPFTLAISVLFFSRIELTKDKIQRLFFIVIMPIIGAVFIASLSTFTAKDIYFTESSNFITSGGFGPNQVSTVIGFGALLCWILLLLQDRISKSLLILVLLLWFITQGILTFSRGGVYNFLIAGLSSMPFLLKKKRQLRGLTTIILSLIFFSLIILPLLSSFTSGKFEDRYGSMNTTGRSRIVMEDLVLWENNFLLGVGPGGSQKLRDQKTSALGTQRGGSTAAHIEYSRMIADHGVLGLLALFLLLAMGFQAYRQASYPWARGVVLALLIWSLAAMANVATRLALMSFAFGVAQVKLREKE